MNALERITPLLDEGCMTLFSAAAVHLDAAQLDRMTDGAIDSGAKRNRNARVGVEELWLGLIDVCIAASRASAKRAKAVK